MAVCEIWDVRGRLDHPIDYAENPEKTANPKYTEADLQAMVDVMEYATNKDKPEQRFFVTGINCDPTTATASRASSTVRLRQSRLTRSALNLPSECGATDFKSSLPLT